jgi:hypothetical protein
MTQEDNGGLSSFGPSADTTTAVTADTTTPSAYTKQYAGKDYTLDPTAVTGLYNQIVGQGTMGKWTGEGFGSAEANAKAIAENLAASGVTDLSQIGQKTITTPESSYETEQGTQYTPESSQTVLINTATGQPLISDYDRASGNAFSGTFAGEGNTAYRVDMSTGKPIVYTTGASSSDVGDLQMLLAAASFVPGVAPFAQGLNAAISAGQGNYTGAILGALGAGQSAGLTDIAGIPISDAKNIVGGINAIDKGNLAGLVNSAAGYAGASLPSEVRTGLNLANAANAFANNDYAGLANAAASLTGSGDAKLAASALRMTEAFNKFNATGDPTAMMNAAQAFNNTIQTATKAGRISTNISDAGDVNLPQGIQLAGLRSDTMSDAGNGFNVEISGAPIFAESKNASSVSAPLGYRLMSSSEADARPEGAYYDMTANAWFAPEDLNASMMNQSDADLFNQSAGDIGNVKIDNNEDENDTVKYVSPKNLGTSGDVPELVVQNKKTTSGDVPELVVQDKKTTSGDVPELVIQDKKTTSGDVPELVIQDKKIVDDVPELVIQDKKIVDDVVTPPVVNPPVVIPPVVNPPVVTPPVVTTAKPAAPEKPSAPLAQPKLSYKKTYEETPFLNPLLFSLAGVPVPSQDNKENILTSDIEEEKIKKEEEDKQKEAPALDLLSFFSFAEGGMVPEHPMGQPEFYSEGGAGTTYIQGRGDGTSDQIPAMVANSEYVLPADIVSALGNGSSESGASVLDQFIETIRAHKHSNPPSELPPESKGPLEYLSSVHMKGKR